LPRSYWDFAAVRRAVEKARPETPGTPPVAIVLQVAEALRMIHEEGLDSVYARHAALARRVREGIDELGLSLQCPELPRLSATMTAVALPAGIEPRALRERIKTRGILTAGGLGPFESVGFRIGHMGDIRMADVERTMDALRHSIDELRANETGAPTQASRPERVVAS
jgi:alanine-glyoxylate transaminase/serine-glyoxylate transaminase/serine-pyruvate transaminase